MMSCHFCNSILRYTLLLFKAQMLKCGLTLVKWIWIKIHTYSTKVNWMTIHLPLKTACHYMTSSWWQQSLWFVCGVPEKIFTSHKQYKQLLKFFFRKSEQSPTFNTKDTLDQTHELAMVNTMRINESETCLLQPRHRHLYTTSAPHRDPHTTHEMSVELLWALSEGFTGVPTPPHFPVQLQWHQQQTGLSANNVVYPMHFTDYSLQWSLQNLRLSNFPFLLNDSKGNEQPRIQARFEHYP